MVFDAHGNFRRFLATGSFLVFIACCAIYADQGRLLSGSSMPGMEIGDETWSKAYWLTPETLLNVPSIADLDGDRFLAANFNAILEVDPRARTIRDIGITGSDFQPAGIAYDEKSGTLFSANYLRNNVTAYRRSGQTWQKVGKFDGFTSPEGIWFDSVHSVLAVAEFDGNRATLLQVSVGDRVTATKLWSREVGYAHGITVLNQRVYVTSLLTRQIVEFDLEGNLLSANGKTGWKPEELGMLWPTSILPDGDGHLIVSDAETGYVWIYDPGTRSFLSKIGGSGPGRSKLVQPYVASMVGERLVVVSTKAQRFLFLSYPNMRAEMSLVQDDRLWVGMPRGQTFFGLGDWDGYSWKGGPRITLLGKDFLIRSAGLEQLGNSKGNVRIGYNIPTVGSISYVKQLAHYRNEGVDFLFSPYSAQGVAFLEKKHRLYSVWFEMPRDCWPLDGRIACASVPELDVSNPISRLRMLIKESKRLACPDGHLTYRQLIDALMGATGYPQDEIERLLVQVFDPTASKAEGFDSAGLLRAFSAQKGCEIDPKTREQVDKILSFKTKPVITIDQLSILSLLR